MAEIRGRSDARTRAVKKILENYENDHPEAVAVVYRQNPASIRVRIVDPKFAGANKVQRHDDVWDTYVARLPEDVQSDITVLLLLTPDELDSSFMNEVFEHPVRSRL